MPSLGDQNIISDDEYTVVRPHVSFSFFMTHLSDRGRLAPLARELERAHTETASALSALLLGLTDQAAGNHEDAIRLLSTSTFDLASSDRQLAFTALADSYKALELSDRALAHYRDALAMGESSRIHVRIGRMLLDLGRTDTAVEEFARALDIDSSMVEVYSLLARAYREKGDSSRAEEMEAQSQNLGEANAGRLHFENGVREYFEKDYARAVREYLKSLAINSAMPIMYVNLGHAYLIGGRPSKAGPPSRKHFALNLTTPRRTTDWPLSTSLWVILQQPGIISADTWNSGLRGSWHGASRENWGDFPRDD